MAKSNSSVLFTDRQRKYLEGDLELEKSEERSIRGKIRNRIGSVLSDFPLANETISSKDLRLIGESDTDPNDGPLDYSNHSPSRGKRLQNLTRDPTSNYTKAHPERPDHDKMSPEMQEDVLGAFQFLFKLCEAGNVDPVAAVEKAMVEYYNHSSQHDYVANLSLKPQKSEANVARQKMKRGENLSPTEVEALIAEGYEFTEPEDQ